MFMYLSNISTDQNRSTINYISYKDKAPNICCQLLTRTNIPLATPLQYATVSRRLCSGLTYQEVGRGKGHIDCEKFHWLANWLLPPDI